MNISTNLSIKDFVRFNTSKVDAGIYYRNVCGQIDVYLLKTGIIIVLVYLFFCWFNWWFFNYGYKFKLFNYDKNSKFGRFIGDLNNLDTRIYWDNFIKSRLLKLTIGYIVVVIYFNL